MQSAKVESRFQFGRTYTRPTQLRGGGSHHDAWRERIERTYKRGAIARALGSRNGKFEGRFREQVLCSVYPNYHNIPTILNGKHY